MFDTLSQFKFSAPNAIETFLSTAR